MTFDGNPGFLRDFVVAGFRFSQALGDAGTLALELEARRPTGNLPFEDHATLQEFLGLEVRCEDQGWAFRGVVETVSYESGYGNFHLVARDALSKLNDGCASRVFAETTLQDVISELLRDGPPHRLVGDIGSSRITLAIQYQESHLAFLKRLVTRCGGHLWFAPEELVIGNEPDGDCGVLRIGREVQSFSLTTASGRETIDLKSISYADQNRIDVESLALKNSGFGTIQDAVIRRRTGNQSPASIHVVHEDGAHGDGKYFSQNLLRSRAGGRFLFTGSSTVPVKVGANLELKNFSSGSGGKEASEHVFVRSVVADKPSASNDVMWRFEATNHEALLYDSDELRNTIHTSTAIVSETAEATNRVKVCFSWDETQTKTPWLRMSAPSWGRNHACYLPPKEGDNVLVMWGQWDMDAVVLGSLPAGEEVSSPGDVFVLETVEGHRIAIDGNSIHVTNGTTEVSVTPDKVVITTANGHSVEIGDENISLQHAGGSGFEIEGGKITIDSRGDLVLRAAGNVELANDVASVKLSGPSVSINNGALEIT